MSAPTYEVTWDPLYKTSPITGCVAWWRFDEGTGSDVSDETGVNDGTAAGGLTWAVGHCPGFSGEFNSSAYVDCGNDSSLNFTSGDFSLEFWAYFDDLSTYRFIFCRGDFTKGYSCYIGDNLRLYFYTYQAATSQYSASTAFAELDTWYHIVITRTGAVVKIYVDGVDVTDISGTHIDPDTSNNNVKIGVYDDGAFKPFSGYLDDVRVYNSCLSAATVLAHYDLEKPITTDCKYATIEYGKNSKLRFDQVKAQTGRCSLVVNNLSSKWCPEVTTSPLYPYVTPNKPFRIRAELSGTIYPLFYGFLASDLPRPEPTQQMATLSILDGLDYLSKAEVNISLQEAQLSGVIKGALLDSAGWHAAMREIDTGIDTFDLYYTKDAPKCLSKLREIDDSEIDFTYIDNRGYLAGEDRHHRLKSPHTTSQGTFTEALDLSDMRYDYGIESVRNEITVGVTPHILQSSAVIWTLIDVDSAYAPVEVPLLNPGESIKFWGVFDNFAKNVSAALQRFSGAPQQATDEIRANSVDDNSGADHSGAGDLGITVTVFSDRVMIELENLTASPFYITLLRINGQVYSDENSSSFSKSDDDSQDQYQVRTLALAGGEFRNDPNEAKYLLDYALALRRNPQPEIDNVKLIGDTNSHCVHVLERTVSDRITITAALYGIDGDYFINKVKLDIPMGGDNPSATWTVVRCDEEEFCILDVSRLDDPGCRLSY